MPDPARSFTRSALAAALALHGTAAFSFAQTACGSWTGLFDGLLGNIGRTSQTRVSDLLVFDAGDGPMLYMAGNFEVVVDSVFGEVRAPGLARWDGERWSAVPGLDGPGLELDARVITLEVFDDGTGPALYIGGEFTTAAGLEAMCIARWDGTTWSSFEGPGSPGLASKITDIHFHDFGDGPSLYVAGAMLEDLSPPALPVLRWDDGRWIRPGVNPPESGYGHDLASFDGHLYLSGGERMLIEAERISGIARFDGEDWSMPVGQNQRIVEFGSEFWPLLPIEMDGQDVLLAGGAFSILEGEQHLASAFAAWDGERWLSAKPDGHVSISTPTDFALFDDGFGWGLFMAGSQIQQRSSSAGVLRAGELQSLQGLNGGPGYAVVVHDDGSGPALLVGGEFDDPTGRTPYLGRWQPNERCPLDFNGDCRADMSDFLALKNLFDAGDPAADFDADGVLSVFDFLSYQNAFDLGCP